MTEPESPLPDGRLDTMLPGVPVEAKISLLLGLAGGLFLAIILSYTNPALQSAGLGFGIGLGILGALVLFVRAKRNHRNQR